MSEETKSKKINIPDLDIRSFLQAVGFLIILGTSYFSLTYLAKGDLITIAVPIILIVSVFAFLVSKLTYFKNLPENVGMRSGEKLFLGLYVISFILIVPLMIHAFNCEWLFKDEIKEKANKRITLIESMATDYKSQADEEIQLYEQGIKTEITSIEIENKSKRMSKIKSFLEGHGLENYDDFEKESKWSERIKLIKDQKAILVSKKSKEFFDKFENLKNENIKYTENAKSVIENWDRHELNNTLEGIEKKLETNQSFLTERFSGFKFKPDSVGYPDLTNIKDSVSKAKLISIPLILVTFLCVLAPYIGRRKGTRRYYSSSK